MNDKWMRGVLTLGIAAGAALGVACGGAQQQDAVSVEEIANLQLASLRIEGMT